MKLYKKMRIENIDIKVTHIDGGRCQAQQHVCLWAERLEEEEEGDGGEDDGGEREGYGGGVDGGGKGDEGY